MTTIAELGVKLTADYAKFSADLDRANQDAKKAFKSMSVEAVAMGNAIAEGASFAIKELFNLSKNTLALGDQFANLKARTGVGVEALGGLKFAAEQSDATLAGLSRGLKNLNVAIGQALRDDAGKAAKAFRALGIDINEAAKGGTSAVFSEIADAIKRAGSAAEFAVPGTALLGKSFFELTPTLQLGKQGLSDAADQAKRLGLVLSEETAQASADFNDNVDVINSAVQGFANALAAELLPALASYTKLLADSSSQGNGFAESAKVFGDILKAAGLIVVTLKNAVEALTNILVGLFDALARIQQLDFAGAQIAVKAALDGVAESGRDVAAAYDAAFGSAKKLNEEQSKLASAMTRDIAFFDTQDREKELERIQAQAAAERKRTEAIAAGKRAIEERSAAIQKELEAAVAGVKKAQEADEAAKAAAIASLVRLTQKYDPLRAAALAFAKAQREIELSLTGKDRQRALELLTREYEAQKKAIEDTLNPIRAKLRSIDEEIAATKRLSEARQLGQAAYNAQLLIENEQRRLGRDLSEKEIQALKEKSKLLDAARDELTNSDGIRTLRDAWERATREGIEDGANGASLKAFFDALKKGVAEAFKDPLQAAADSTGLLSDIVLAARRDNAGGGNSVGAGFRAVNNALADSKIPVVSQISQILRSIDSIAGGRLFGTSNQQVASGQSAQFSQAGFAGQTTAFFERQRSLFRGTARSSNVTAADQQAQQALDQFFEQIVTSVAQGSRLLSVQVPALITGAFEEVRDKDGKITKQISQVGGRIFNEAFEDFQRRLQAENIIAIVAQTASDASSIADQWRSNAGKLLEGSRFFLIAQADFVNGVKLLGSEQNLGGLTKVIQDLAAPGEELSEAYVRVRNSTLFLRDALQSIGAQTSKTAEEFVRFSAGLVETLGGLQNAGAIIERVLTEFFSPIERAAAALSNANARALQARDAAEAALGFDIDTSRIAQLVTDAISGVFTPSVASAVLLYADAQADLNALTREAAAASAAAAEAEQERIRALKEAAQELESFTQGLADQLADLNGRSDYQRALASIAEQYRSNTAELTRLSTAAGEGAFDVRGFGLATQLAAAQTQAAVRQLNTSVLNDLLSLYETAAKPPEFNFTTLGLPQIADATAQWRQELEAAERTLQVSALAQNLRDLFAANQETFANGVARLQIPIRDILRDLGVSLTNVTSSQSLAAFGAAARTLGVSAEELARVAGLDLTTLSPEQSALIEEARNRQTMEEANSDYLRTLSETAAREEEARKDAEAKDREEAKQSLDTQKEIARILLEQNQKLDVLSDALTRAGLRGAVGV